MNHLYFGDCLDVLKDLHQNNPPFIDLIYIDPPFNSKRNYNILFESIDMKDATAQKQAFTDTWSNVVYIIELNNLAELNKDLFDVLTVFEKSKAVNDSAVAYLTTMAHRIWYMHKLLKNTGSFYLHCDPNMSHYLKMICDIIFGNKNFRNEIVWQRTAVKGDVKNKFGAVHDVVLFYSKSSKYVFGSVYSEKDSDYNDRFSFDDQDGRGPYQSAPLDSPNPRPNLTYEYRGFPSPPNGWRVSLELMRQLDAEGRLIFPRTQDGRIRRKVYLYEQAGPKVPDVWVDIPPLQASEKERLGYPTQKPEILMERIINASTKEGDIVADFFCGCGTTIAAAEKLKRKWLGADISHLAIKLILQRLISTYGAAIKEGIKLHGLPKDVAQAKMLARETDNGRFGFQDWVIEVLLHGVVNAKKTGDGGYDGYLTFQGEKAKEFVLIETKSGGVNVKNVREFIQVVGKQKAAAGVFVCFADSLTKEMLKEAKAAGKIELPNYKSDIDKIQILTVDDILNNGKQPHLPNISSTFKQAERLIQKSQIALSF